MVVSMIGDFDMARSPGPHHLVNPLFAYQKMELLLSTQPVLSMWPWKIKLEEKKSKRASSNEEKSKHASLAQQNSFGPAFFSNFAVAGEWHSKA